jgi:outer membrane protein, heavy metal efflux system
MRLSSLRAALLAVTFLPALACAAPLTLDEAVSRAVQRSEATRAARAGIAGAGETARAAGQLPDPMLGVSVENLPVTGADRFSTTREGMTMKRIAFSQEWVPAAKRSLRVAAANAATAREAAALAVAAADTRLQASLAYIEAYYAWRGAELAAEGEHHAHESVVTARARMAAGGGSASDVLALSAEQGMAGDETREARQQFASASANLSRWTGTPTAGELAAPKLAAEGAESAYVEAHPAVVAKKRELDAMRQEAAVARSNRQPNWTWEVAYGQRTGMSDLVSVGLNIPLPVAPAARQDRETAAKLALADKAEAELNETVRAAQGEYRILASDARLVRERIAAYESGVARPAAQRTAVATAAYRSNQASLAMVFEARHAELAAQRKLLALERELAKAQAQLTFKPVKAEELQ